MSIPATLPVIAVLDATGPVGGGLARAVLHRGGFALRAVLGGPVDAAALALQAQGATLVQADPLDEGALAEAFAGAQGLFAVTTAVVDPDRGPDRESMSDPGPEQELAQGLAIARAAARAKVGHLVWATREDTRRWVPLDDPQLPTLQGRWKVPHFDAKGAANLFFRDCGVAATLLHAPCSWDEWFRRAAPLQRDAQGGLVLTLPTADRPLAGIAAADLGACAMGLFEAPRRHAGRSLGVAAAPLTGAEMALALSVALQQPCVHRSPTPADYALLAFADAAAMANMFQFETGYAAELAPRRSLALARELHPGLLDFAGWAHRHGRKLARDAGPREGCDHGGLPP